MSKHRNIAIVLAAGSSQRFSGDTPKQLAALNNKPLVLHCLQAFQNATQIDQLILVAAPNSADSMRELVANYGMAKVAEVIPGGNSRQESVKLALRHLVHTDSVPELVLVHDAARPLIDAPFINSIAAAARKYAAAVPVVPCNDTVKLGLADNVQSTIPRPREGGLYLTQTPQGFHWDVLASAHNEATATFSDDASLVEASGVTVRMVPGLTGNVKITTPDDLRFAERLLSAGEAAGAEWSYGTGYDAHQLAPPGPLKLGGILIEFEQGLKGHSDADVLLHSVADAVLGGSGLGDMGKHFPDDPRWKDADSAELLLICAAEAKQRGWLAVSVDATVAIMSPRLASYLPLMERRISEVLGIEEGRVNIGATTTDGLGVVAAGGVAAHAIVAMRRVSTN